MDRLKEEYFQLLSQHGIENPRSQKLSPEIVERLKHKVATKIIQSSIRDGTYDSTGLKDILTKIKEWDGIVGEDKFSEFIQPVANKFADAARKIGKPLQTPVYCNVFPTGDFNAMAVPRKSGYLILINRGTFDFISKMLIALSHSMMFVDKIPSPTIEEIPSNVSGDSRFNKEERASFFAQVVIDYILSGDALDVDMRFPMASGGNMPIVQNLLVNILNFMVAHEFGHAICGHLTDRKLAISDTKSGKLKIVSKNWDQEFEADRYGFNLIIASTSAAESGSIVIDTQLKEVELSLAIGGVLIFLSMADTINQVSSVLARHGHFVASETHPPPKTRAKILREGVENWPGLPDSASQRMLAVANSFTSIISSFTEDIIQTVKKKMP